MLKINIKQLTVATVMRSLISYSLAIIHLSLIFESVKYLPFRLLFWANSCCFDIYLSRPSLGVVNKIYELKLELLIKVGIEINITDKEPFCIRCMAKVSVVEVSEYLMKFNRSIYIIIIIIFLDFCSSIGQAATGYYRTASGKFFVCFSVMANV